MRAKRASAGFGLATAALIAALGLPVAQAGAARGLKLGLTDPIFESGNSGTRAAWLNRAAGARADSVLLAAPWAAIAPAHRPAGFNAPNPGDPGYSWGTLDAAVRDAKARRLDVTVIVTGAPRWAEGKHRRRTALAGTWKPQPKALKQFGQAIAKRYSGHYGGLPRVKRFQLWSEPNLSTYLTPQWKRGKPVGPEHYRAMLNGFYRGVHSAVHSDKVLTGGTAPYGDPGHGQRMQPAEFWRTLLCLRGKHLRTAKCRHPAHFDIAALNPINVGAPTRHALNRDDISTPDIGKLKRILRRARQTKRALPRHRKPIWATEIWWDSRPPDPHGIPIRRQARWLEQSFYVLWKQGVKSVTWFLIRDQAAHGDFAGTVQSGLFFHDGKPKPARRAFAFPFVGDRVGRHRVRVWGEAPGAGAVRVERKRGHRWRAVKRLHSGRNRVFNGVIHLSGRGQLRARSHGATSLVWTQR